MRGLIMVLLLLVPLAVLGKSDSKKHDNVQFDPAAFAEQRAALERAIATEQRYAELSDEDRAEVAGALDTIGALMERHGSIATMPANDKNALFNAQELVNTRLTQAAEDSRLICRREKVIGSNLRQQVCMTVAQRRQMREDSQRAARNQGRSLQPGSWGSGG